MKGLEWNNNQRGGILGIAEVLKIDSFIRERVHLCLAEGKLGCKLQCSDTEKVRR